MSAWVVIRDCIDGRVSAVSVHLSWTSAREAVDEFIETYGERFRWDVNEDEDCEWLVANTIKFGPSVRVTRVEAQP